MMRKRFTILPVTLVLFFIFAMFPGASSAQSGCPINPGIPLEIFIGNITVAHGLTEHIIEIYTFVVGSIGIITAVMIMFWGLRWAAAAGNQEIIGKAKEGIKSALIGLVLALASYVILFSINSNLTTLPSICPNGLNFKTAEEVPKKSNGETCSVNTECDSGICNSFEKKCVAGTEAITCTVEADCSDGYQCKLVTTGAYSQKKCQPFEKGDECDDSDANKCDGAPPYELFCVDSHCQLGTLNSPCDFGEPDCREGLTCKKSGTIFVSYVCLSEGARSAGDSCDAAVDGDCDPSANPALFCVEEDGNIGAHCFTGQEDQPCDESDDCADTLGCVNNKCHD